MDYISNIFKNVWKDCGNGSFPCAITLFFHPSIGFRLKLIYKQLNKTEYKEVIYVWKANNPVYIRVLHDMLHYM